MNSAQLEKSLQSIISWGILCTILAVTTFVSIEPVNIPKMFLLSILGFAAIAILATKDRKLILEGSRSLLVAIAVFVFVGALALLFTKSPKVQAFYGVFGRNTGFLTYFVLALLMLTAAALRSQNSHKKILNFILISGAINSVYCLIALFGYDLLSWNNTYGKILGTLGNPDFIAAFLGICICISLPMLFHKTHNYFSRFVGLIFVFLCLYEIKRSGAQQGFFVVAVGVFILVFFGLKAKFASKIPILGFTVFSALIGAFTLGGILQKGPLTDYVYKPSVSLRGIYWQAGIKMGLDHPVLGIGFDSYGDNYRQARSAQALLTPGANTVTNAAHNVFIDVFANGGFPLLIAYLAIIVITLRAIFILVSRNSSYDPLLVALISGWAGYQIQSVVSINQIGLAICGWVLAGLLISYEIITRPDAESKVKIKTTPKNASRSGTLAPGLLGGFVGLVIALPPLVADISWRSALNNSDGQKVIRVSTAWPQDIYRMNQITSALEQNGFFEEAAANARKAVEFNPYSFDAWQILYRIQKSTQEEKTNALRQLHFLDPLNPNPA